MPPLIELPDPKDYSGKLSELARDYITSARETMAERVWSGAGGIETAHGFSDCVDELVRFVFDVTTSRFVRRYARGSQQYCAVIAQGGYGRREMNPWSDVDLLVVYPGRIGAYVETVNERLLHTLFDAGLQVGHAVRTLRDCIDQADNDLTVKTTLLDGRFLVGERDLGQQFVEEVRDVLAARDVRGFLEQKLSETRERHQRMGSSVFLLEPNVKDGEGGLRDLHTLVWIGRVTREIASLRDLSASGICSGGEQSQLIAAHDFLLRVRSALHFLARFKQDKLSFEQQEQIAERFGYASGDRHAAVDLFMRDYYSNAAVVARTGGEVIARLTAPPEPTGLFARLASRTVRDGVTLSGGQLVADRELFEHDPVNVLRVFIDAQRADVGLSAATQQAVRRAADLLTPEVVGTEAAVDTFMAILKAKDGVYRTLAELNRLGVLGKMIPEFGRLFCMVQHDFYHVYTVDEHSLIGIRELERLRDGAYEEESPLLTQTMRECDQPEILYLGMMFHDLGKGYGGDHDERGAVMVRDVAKRLMLQWDDRRGLEFLVRQHLTMSMLAQHRDVEDPKLVGDFVRKVGNLQNLRNLYLLTFADMKAVGPKVWNGWKDQLLGELYERAIEVFETGRGAERNLEARVRRVKQRVLRQAAGADESRRLERFLDGMSTSYLLSNTDDRIIDHWRLSESLGTGTFRSGVAHFVERGFSELAVCAPDQPGLFVRLAGVLSANRLNILSAKIETSSTGVAIDTFRIDHAHEEVDPLRPEVWQKVRRDIEAVLTGRAIVDEMVAEARRTRPASKSVRRARARIVSNVGIDNDVSDRYTVIDVYAADRPGLLFTLANCLYRSGLELHLAKISTRVVQVLDVFYVTEADGEKITRRERHAEIRELILESIRESDEQEAGKRPSVRSAEPGVS